MSLRPAIGVPFLPHLKKMMENPRYARVFGETSGGLPLQIRIGGKCYPLGRSLRGALGLLCDKEPDYNGWLDAHGEQVLAALRAGERVDSYFSRVDDGKYRRIKARYKIYSNRTIE